MENSFPLRSVPFWAKLFLNPVLFTSSESTAPSVIGRVPSRGISHAFAKRDATWDALVGLQLFDHTFHRAHQALRLPCEEGVHRYRQQSPALALGLTDHLWSFQALLASRVPRTPSWGHDWLFRLVDFLLLILLAFSSRESLGLPTSSSLGLVLRIGLLDTGAFVASALGFATGQVAIVSVLGSLSNAGAVVLTAIFLRERLHVIQWLLIGMLLAEAVLTHVERICCIQPIGTNPHPSTSLLERRSCGILLS